MADLTQLHPDLVKAYTQTKAAWLLPHPDKPPVVLTCTYRSKDEQNRLYAQGRTTKGPRVTNAVGGASPHNYNPSFAFDIAFSDGKKLIWTESLFDEFARILLTNHPNVTWGGHFKSILDRPHFELTGWKKLIKK